MARSERERVHDAVAALPLWAREVYWLSAVDELDHAEIAGRLGIGVADVEWLLVEALYMIVLHLRGDGLGEGK